MIRRTTGSAWCRVGCLVFAVVCLIGIVSTHSQTVPASTRNVHYATSSLSGGPVDSSSFNPEGLIIDTIIIDNRNIYDIEDPRYSGFLFKTVNRLHMVTRAHLIKDELLFESGDRYSDDIALETARNLRVRFPFNDAWIETEPVGDSAVVVRVVTIDQWSLIGGVRSLSTDGNETNIKLGFEERNLLGYARFLSIDYGIQEKDDNYITALYRSYRTFGKPIRLELDYSNNPTGEFKELTVARPFYNLDQRFSFQMEMGTRGGRTDRYFEGRRVAQWESDADEFSLELNRRWGSYHRKIGLIAEYEYLYKRSYDRGIYIGEEQTFDVADFPADSLYHQVNVGVEFTFRRYLVVKRINGFEYNEDFDAGAQFGVKVGRAFRPGFEDHLYDYAEFEALATRQFSGFILTAEYDRAFWFRREEDLRRQTQFLLRLYNNSLPFMTLAMESVYFSDKSNDPYPIHLGGKTGIRGYDTFFRSGDRAHFINLESRFFPGLELLSVKIGGALFTDLGRTFLREQDFTFRDYYVSVGGGLRLSFEKWSRTELLRCDVALTRGGQWELSVGTGQYF